MVEPNHDDAVERIAELARCAAVSATNDGDERLSRQRFLARLDSELLSPCAKAMKVLDRRWPAEQPQ